MVVQTCKGRRGQKSYSSIILQCFYYSLIICFIIFFLLFDVNTLFFKLIITTKSGGYNIKKNFFKYLCTFLISLNYTMI